MRNWLFTAATLALVGISNQARAIDFSTVLVDFRGDPIVDETRPGPRDSETGKLTQPRFCFKEEFEKNPTKCDALTLGVAAANSLLRGKEDVDTSVEELKRRGLLAARLAKGGIVTDLTPEDVALIRKLSKTYYAPIVSSQVIMAMEKK